MIPTLIISQKGETSYEPVPGGLHAAACVGVYDLGTLPNERFQNAQRKLMLTWELTELPPLQCERNGVKTVTPRCVSRLLTMSLNEKGHLLRLLESWRGRKFSEQELTGFDLAKLLGAPCQVQVLRDASKEGRTYANVTNVLPPPKGHQIKPAGPLSFFTIKQLAKPELPPDLPEWIGKMVVESKEWKRLVQKNSADASPVSAENMVPGEAETQSNEPF